MENVDSLNEMLSSADPYLRRGACEAIGEGRNEGFIASLVGSLRDDDPGVREAALNALTLIGGEKVAEAVSPLLKEESAALRNMGVEILELVGPRALGALLHLLTDKDDDVVKFAVDIIANIREERAVNALFQLISHRNPNVRASVALCLGKLKSQAAVPALLAALNDSEEWVRFSAIEGIGLLQDRRALEPLIAMIEKDSGLIKDAAIDAAGKLASPKDAASVLTKLEPMVRKGKIMNTGALVELLDKAMAPGADFRPSQEFKKTYFGNFARTVTEGDRPEQLLALKGLGLLKMAEGLPYAFDFLDKLNDIDEETEAFIVDVIVALSGRGPLPKALVERVKTGGRSLKLIVRALGEMKSREAVPILKDLIAKAAKHELREVFSALEAIGSMSSLEVLYQALEGSDGHSRKIAARALGSLAGPSAVGSLFKALEAETYRDVLEEITDVLALIPAEQVRKGFCGLLKRDDERLREMGARGLGLIGDEEALEFLKIAATDNSPNVRKSAYKAMARLGIPNAVDEVIKGLSDENDDVKLSVLKGLGGWTGEKITAALTDALRDRNIWVRYHAVLLLGEMGEPGVEGVIIEKLLKDEAPVKAAAAKALERLCAVDAVEVLMQFIEHPDPTVRGAVESAIETLRC